MNISKNNLIKTNALIEQHIHGGFGIDFSTCHANGFVEFSKKILKYGVCGFFPTLATDAVENLKRQISEIKKAQEIQNSLSEQSAKILGVHLEACFLNSEKKGIHDSSQLLKPTIENYKLLEDDVIKIVTLAPELDENFELCMYLKNKGVRVSAGHCVGCDLSEVEQVTHLYNAMGAFSHKDKSTVVSALSDDRLAVELIADGIHVQDDVLKITFKTKPTDKVILISDALPITHSDLSEMDFCSKKVFLKDGKAVDANGTMAGSTMFLSDIIKRLVQNNLLQFETAVKMASDNINYIEPVKAFAYWDKGFNVVGVELNGKFINV